MDLGLRKARRGEESRKHLFFILKEDGKDDNSGRWLGGFGPISPEGCLFDHLKRNAVGLGRAFANLFGIILETDKNCGVTILSSLLTTSLRSGVEKRKVAWLFVSTAPEIKRKTLQFFTLKCFGLRSLNHPCFPGGSRPKKGQKGRRKPKTFIFYFERRWEGRQLWQVIRRVWPNITWGLFIWSPKTQCRGAWPGIRKFIWNYFRNR